MNTPVIRETRVRCSRRHAFTVFTERIDAWWPEGHRRFGSDSTVTLEATAGGRFSEQGPNGEDALLGEVLLCDPPARILYTWYPGAISGPTLVEITFSEDAGETLVRVVHSEGDSELGELWPTRAAKFSSSWDEVLPAFAGLADATAEETERHS